MDTKNVINRLKSCVASAGVTNSAFASAAGIDASNFSKMLGGSLTITPASLKKIATAHDINYAWLLDGVGSPALQVQGDTDTRPRLPVTAMAGIPGGFADSVALRDCEQMPVIKMLPAYDFTLPISGDSMLPYYLGGDEIAIRKINSFIEWGRVYVLDTRDGAIIKCVFDAGDKYRCHSYNENYPDFYVDKNDVYGIYKVVGLIRM